MSSDRYSMYIGRFQPFHDGHEWCVRRMLNKGKKVCIAIMDIHHVEPKKNPYPTKEVYETIWERFRKEVNIGEVKIIDIPPIESVNYGRDVGYDLNELKPPSEIKKISATNIRKENGI